MRSAVMLALLAVLLGGCERIFVSTEAEFSEVDVACVDTAIRRVPGVSGVDHWIETSEALKAASADGETLRQSHTWDFDSKEPAFIRLDHDGRRWRFMSYAMQWGTAWTSLELDRFSPEMAGIHRALMQQCGLRIPRETRVERD